MAKRRGNQEGSIYHDKKRNIWVAEIMTGWKQVVDPETGEIRQKRKRVKLYGKTRQEVRDKLAEVVNQRAQGVFVEPSKITVADWLDRWLQDYKKMELRPTTWESYFVIVKNHLKPEVGKLPLRDLRPEHLQRLYNEKLKTLSPRRVRYIHTVIHQALKQAVKNGLVARFC